MTIDNICSKCLAPKLAHIWTFFIKHCHTLSKVAGGYKWFDRREKCVGEVSVHFHKELYVYTSVL